jgi:uncharacterized protein YkwD
VNFLARLLAFLRPAPRPVAPPAGPATPPGDVAGPLLALHNRARAAAGLRPLALDARLCAAAADHARAMAAAADHARAMAAARSLTHSGWDAEIAREGGQGGATGQNIAEGYATAESVFAGWWSDAPHRANIVNGSFTRAGFACAADAGGTLWWAADFGG